MPATFKNSGVSLKVADRDDDAMIDVLSELDSAPPLSGTKLVAFVDGWPVAAMSLDDGRVVANPFTSTVQAIDLMRMRAHQLAPASRSRRRPSLRRVRRLRLA
jgi:hypothetical protein